MPRTSFSFHEGYPVVEVTFSRADRRGPVVRRLVVDTGFTGRSSFTLRLQDRLSLLSKRSEPADVLGALSGTQDRVSIVCSVPSIAFEGILIAIVTDLAPLRLPSGVDGLAGLTFLEHFRAWGAERNAVGAWGFFLET